MANFNYIATSASGKNTKGSVEADSREAAIESLRKQNLRVISVKADKSGSKFNISIGGKVKSKDLVIFTRQLATLVNAGVPLSRSLSTLQAQTASEQLKKELAGVVKKVEAGSALGDALSDYPKTFSTIYVNMIKAGEEGGILDEVLKRLAVQQEKDAAIRGKIKGAMTYPAVISVITFVAFFFLMTTIVPKIGDIITSLGGADAKLPVYTIALLAISKVLKNPKFIVSFFVTVPVFVFVFKNKTTHVLE